MTLKDNTNKVVLLEDEYDTIEQAKRNFREEYDRTLAGGYKLDGHIKTVDYEVAYFSKNNIDLELSWGNDPE